MTAAACGPDRETQQRLVELEAVAVENDSLLAIITENARAMSEIGATLAGVESGEQQLQVSTESPLASSRDSLIARVRIVAERVASAEERLNESRRRVRAMTRQSDSLGSRIGMLEQSIADFQQALDAQRLTLEKLNERVETLTRENRALTIARAALADSLTTVEAEARTAYYIVGTEDELLERGVVRKEGGARFLFIFGRRGQTLVPAPTLDTALFTPIDTRDVQAIVLPDSGAEYRIASNQDVTALETPPDEDGDIVADTLRITDPRQFWRPSRFLIVVRR